MATNTNCFGYSTMTTGNDKEYIDIDIDGNRLCSIFINEENEEINQEAKLNAERLVKIWNEYDKLKEERYLLMQALDAMLDTFVYSKKATSLEKIATTEFSVSAWAKSNTHAFPRIGDYMNAKKIIEDKEKSIK